MKRAKKIIAVFLGVLLLISCLTATVFAAETNTQDGLTAVIQTDKENYSANEDIHITVTVTNNNSFEVKNVSIESFLPDTLTLKDGDLKSKTLDLQSGETLTLACVVILEKEEQSSSENETSEPTTEETTTEITETTETATETTEQITDETSTAPDTTTSETEESNSETETDDILPIEPSTNESNPDATTESVSQESNPASPDTGDNSPFVKLLIALIIAMAIIAAYIIITKKNNKKATKVISLILCSAIAISSVATIGFIKVGAEESNTQNFTVDKTITVDGRNYTINVNVSYDKTKEVSDTWYQGVDEDHVVTSDSGIKYINNRIIIMFYSETTDEQKQNIISSVNGKIIGINEYGTEYQIEINPTLDLEELRNICHNVSVMNGVRHCYYETVFDPEDLISTVPNDPWEDTFNGILGTDWDENSPGGLNWWLETVEAPSAWEYNKRFNNIKIGIVDNGFDTNHEDLDLTVINPYENSNSGDEAPDHGTHVAGIIGATANNNVGITGMVWNKELYCADVLATKHQKENHISILSIYDGIQKLLEKGCKVVNMSIGKNPPLTEDNDILEQGKTATSKILEWREQLKRDDFIIVQSAGNDGVDSVQNGFFSSITVNGIDEYFSEHKKEAEKYNRYDVFTHFIIVGAIEQDDNKYKLCEENKNPFDLYDFNSNYGYGISIVAPGKKIFSCSQMGGLNGDYIYSSGTSMAAPIVTGVAALVWSVNPNFNAEEVNRIVCTSYNKTAVSSNENDSRSSYPIVNAKLAVEKAVNMTYNVGTATGAFIDSENGSPVSNVYMECVRYTGNIKDVNLSDFNIWVEDNIFYQELYEGTYEYKISVDGYTYNDTVLFDVQKGKTTDVGTIKLFKLNGNVTGVVKDKVTDAPISDVTLEVIDNSAGDFATVATTTTGENGGFSLNLPAGSYSVSFNHPDYVYQGISLTVEKDATTVIMEPVYLTPKNAENPGFAGGDGTIENPYQISTPEQLNAVRNDLDAHYIQINDIDMSGWGNWEPIGQVMPPYSYKSGTDLPYDNSAYFSGSYNGKNYSINNLKINNSSVTPSTDCYGLFAGIKNAVIENVNLNIDYQIEKGSTDYENIFNETGIDYSICVGGIVGRSSFSSRISNCFTSGNINVSDISTAYIGGIIGFEPNTIGSDPTVISSCRNNIDICVYGAYIQMSPTIYVGGIGGYGFTISQCENQGDIGVTNGHTVYCGGIIGNTHYDTFDILSLCKNSGNITVASKTFAICGGIAGYQEMQISKCINYGNISGKVTNSTGYFVYGGGNCDIGGITGRATDNIDTCINHGNISSVIHSDYNDTKYTKSYAGGIVGYLNYNINNPSKISNCCNLAEKINAYTMNNIPRSAGRIAGYSRYISDCYSVNTTTLNGTIPTEYTQVDQINGASLTKEEIEEKLAQIDFGNMPKA